jgi:hypothetical protein
MHTKRVLFVFLHTSWSNNSQYLLDILEETSKEVMDLSLASFNQNLSHKSYLCGVSVASVLFSLHVFCDGLTGPC